ncbi:FadR/GntR family transcriptional regulator [Roseibium aggregatum]|uniref:Pyruvate dehydrogenase complex repressor n=1 Tax=Roseibium aggregatum TaxID=187304 RepID=A0A939J2V8_9HYPH|nr:FadR/GntR family transcriptional regulator [Roseibium aggregatum]MBN9669014.1 FadR family transcriptional regulator [Roseibium aggregatum]
MFQPVEHQNTASTVIEQIEDLILKGVLTSGDRLPSERDLAEQLKVSRPVLRDALKTLEERQLIEARRGGGTFVCDLIGPVFSEAVIDLIARHPKAIDDYFEFRRGIEAQAAEQAARRAAPSDVARLDAIVERMQVAHETVNLSAESRLDVDFHNAVGEAAHNVVLLHTLRSCYRLLENGVFYNRGQLYGHPTARVELLRQHKAIADAIRDGDPARARSVSQDHIDYVRGALAEAEDMQQREQLAGLRRTKSLKQPSRGRDTRRTTQ